MIASLSNMSNKDRNNLFLSAQQLVNAYGRVMEIHSDLINDVALLPAKKEDIKNAVKLMLILSHSKRDEAFIEVLKTAYVHLASFQPVDNGDSSGLAIMNNLQSLTYGTTAPKDSSTLSDKDVEEKKNTFMKFREAYSSSRIYIEQSREECQALLGEINLFVESLKQEDIHNINFSSQDEEYNFFKNCWQGKEKLWKVYWGGALIIGLLSAVVSAMMDGGIATLLSLATLGALVLISVSVWRCAPNTSLKLWTWLARAMMILVWMRTISAVLKT